MLAVDHPCFEIAERRQLTTDPHLIVRDYLTERPMVRPVATDFHRTLGTYLNSVLAAGLTICRDRGTWPFQLRRMRAGRS